ncbi:MAG: aminotransferase [Candidatus Raymondbacteria bacterium RifOxyA12_full_50_37]|uniref:alanine--glyoxylate transaminase n=1 Tax=Candidatus Raymondbacteria bacterium RIFOXYD12_FULL_49_13 TaxID=1817890 RepID=A0A1F7F7T3_UNCRA|nr:MAG: aminotransferase [Candidatus Raymondbacteria bacterium RifOxyA12_full_50_37]OGJ89620.1 MAG: aminotransferase [Candidatus Raymondbacteria bacterium RIFOXYA2_FULL_49_16]OGK01635.1 MAG: aminotransferase [Candidatus Raymondbacteria bacterium RifOxyC12_full_50_8]OGK01840.1 MAG: aminotransferase [Candidatus Raymondbacteria bacterium RifOxyB12_full_50_8]OGK02638.1 MAG: aminotransferase [Candidatus Raymondbacteria bacterium RIFOXYD12_FULL_49_13]OGP42876.1 MAG: aminotransferase [Candidatus Raym
MDTQKLYEKYLITSMVAGFEPVIAEKAFGCVMTGADGKEYIDCFSGIAVCNAGHGHPKVIAAAKKQMEQLVHCCSYVYYSPRTAELAKQLSEISPGDLTKSFFSCSGAEAIEGAMRIAKQHTKRKELVALSMSFHGRTAGTLSITGNRGRKKGAGPYLSGIAFAPAPYCYRCPFRLTYPACGCACAHYLDDVLKYQTAGDVAAFVAEPVLGEGGIIVPPREYYTIAVDIIKKDGGVFICDEVQTGFGRTGTMFAIEQYDVEPDIMCMAKGIADGFPLSAFIVKDAIAQAFTPGDHLSTFGGNPVSCAAALANIEVMLSEKLPDAAFQRGEQLMKGLHALKEKYPLIGDVRGKGLMMGIELISNTEKTPAADKAKKARVLCREHGVLVGLGGVFANVLRLQPPLIISEEQATRVLETLNAVFSEIS